MSSPTVAVSHPGGQHVFRLAEALDRHGMLRRLVVGPCFVATADAKAGGRRANRTVRLEPGKVERLWFGGSFAALPQRYIPPAARKYWNHHAVWHFDERAARRIRTLEADVVVAFENSAAATFTALGNGACRVLECPSVHFSRQDYGDLSAHGARFVARINARKAEEIVLAERIVVLSTFAKRTFTEQGIPASKLEVIPLGVDTTFFSPSSRKPRTHGMRFVFAGSATYTKGADLLIAAYRGIPAPGKALRFVGLRTPTIEQAIASDTTITSAGPVDRVALRNELVAADVLVLPSRFDGFGMVVTEAMACGLPVIVSDHVGAADVVQATGPDRCGWVVPAGNVEELRSAMAEAMELGDAREALGRAARRKAEMFTWNDYERRIGALYRGLAGATPRHSS